MHELLANRHALDGSHVEVQGILEVDHGYVNLMARNRQECVGLVTYVEDRARYVALNDHRVAASGIMDAEGCGRNGMCSEHFCGPAILRQVTVTALESR